MIRVCKSPVKRLRRECEYTIFLQLIIGDFVLIHGNDCILHLRNMENKHIAVVVTELIIFQFIRFIWNCAQSLKWSLDGTKQLLDNAKNPSHYEKSAQILDILAQRIFDPISLPNGMPYFILSHQTFVHPEYVLKEEVSLYSVSEDEAVFIEAPLGVHVWQLKYGSFHKLAQHSHACKIIKMPAHSFYQLASEVCIPNNKLIFADFIPRTGSTLLCNLAEATGKIKTYSEPHCLMEPFINFSSTTSFNKYGQPVSLDRAWLRRYFKAVVAMLCKSDKGAKDKYDAYMFKSCGLFSQNFMPMLMEFLPGAHFLFLYRDSLPTAQSMDKSFRATQMTKAYLFFLKPTSRWAWNKIWALTCERAHPITEDPKYDRSVVALVQNSDFSEQLLKFCIWSACVRTYLQYREAGRDISAVKYEDIKNNPEICLQALFKHCNLSLNLVSRAVSALQRDSQANSPLARKNVSNTSTNGLVDLNCPPPQLKQEIDLVNRYFDTQDISESVRLPGTITIPK